MRLLDQALAPYLIVAGPSVWFSYAYFYDAATGWWPNKAMPDSTLAPPAWYSDSHTITKRVVMFLGGYFLDFVWLTTRAAGTHGGALHVRRANRNRTDRRAWVIERLSTGTPNSAPSSARRPVPPNAQVSTAQALSAAACRFVGAPCSVVTSCWKGATTQLRRVHDDALNTDRHAAVGSRCLGARVDPRVRTCHRVRRPPRPHQVQGHLEVRQPSLLFCKRPGAPYYQFY